MSCPHRHRASRSAALVLFASLFLSSISTPAVEDVSGLARVVSVPIGSGRFSRGDCNLDSLVDLSDAVCTLGVLFLGGETTCQDALDTDDSGVLDITDPVYLLNFLFLGGPPPAPPFGIGVCDTDQTIDQLTCIAHAPCDQGGSDDYLVRVENISRVSILAPLLVTVESIDVPGVTVANADGELDGKPFFAYTPLLSGAMLPPDARTTGRSWQFVNPGRRSFEFEVKVWANRDVGAGWLPGLDPVGEDQAEPERSVDEMTVGHVAYRVSLPGMNFRERNEGDDIFQELSIPGLRSGRLEGVGRPAIPTYTQIVAIPRGAALRISLDHGDVRVYRGMTIYPTQPPVEDNLDTPPPPFTLDQKTYESRQAYPPSRVTWREIEFRGLRLAIVQVALAQVYPATGELHAYGETLVNIRFDNIANDGAGASPADFLADRDRCVAAEQLFEVSALNYAVAQQSLVDVVRERVFFALRDLLIVADRDYEEQVERLAQHKRDRGISTNVVYTDAISTTPVTAAEVADRIRTEYLLRRISYVILFGDAEDIPPHYETRHPTGHSPQRMGTDLYYATLGGEDDIVPDIAIGRLPVNSLAEAETVVDKIIGYEDNPPINPAFYSRVGLAAFFQDDNDNHYADRGFAETIEALHAFFDDEGYNPERIYTTNSSEPEFWNDGTAIPAALEMPGFAWDGDAADIRDVIQNGAFLVAHRDHGHWSGGWSEPVFDSTDVANLSNGARLPVVFSINCQTGWFDRETDEEGNATTGESFAERFLTNEDGGAVGVFAATRNSPSWPNNDLLLGMLDCVWPDLIPGYPGIGDAEAQALAGSRELGWMLNYGKLRVVAAYPTEIDGGDNLDGITMHQRELEIYHCLGDPTLRLRTRAPYEMLAAIPPIVPGLVEYPFELPPEFSGARLAITQNGRVLGQGYATEQNAQVFLPLDTPLEENGDTYFVATKDGALPFRVKVDFVRSCRIHSLDVSLDSPGQNSLSEFEPLEKCEVEPLKTFDLGGEGEQISSPSGFIGTAQYLLAGGNVSGGIDMLEFVPGGSPRPVSGSPFDTKGGQPSYFAVNSSGSRLFATTSRRTVEVFDISSVGLSPLGAQVEFEAQPNDLALFESPIRESYLYVGNSHGPHGVSIFRIVATGLQPLGFFDLEPFGADRCGFEMITTPQGFLYVLDLDEGIFSLRINALTGGLELVEGSPFRLGGYCSAFTIVRDGTRLHAVLPFPQSEARILTLAADSAGRLESIGEEPCPGLVVDLATNCEESCLFGAARSESGIARWAILTDGRLSYMGMARGEARYPPTALWVR